MASEQIVLKIWNSSNDSAFIIRGANKRSAYVPSAADFEVLVPPSRHAMITTLDAMGGEDDAFVTWLEISEQGDTETAQVFLLLQDSQDGIRLVPGTLAACHKISPALLWDSAGRIEGCSPFQRSANYVLVPRAAPCKPSFLSDRIRDWIVGEATWRSLEALDAASTSSQD